MNTAIGFFATVLLVVSASSASEAKCVALLYSIEGRISGIPAAGTNDLEIDVDIPPHSWLVEKPKIEGTRFSATVAFDPGVDSTSWFRREECTGKPAAIYVRLLQSDTILDTAVMLPADFSSSDQEHYLPKRKLLLRSGDRDSGVK